MVKKFSYVGRCLLSSQGIWVPKLVFVNTEKKLNTKNDDKAFAVARWVRSVLKNWQGRL